MSSANQLWPVLLEHTVNWPIIMCNQKGKEKWASKSSLIKSSILGNGIAMCTRPEKQKKSDCIPPRNLKLWHFEKFCHMRNLPYCYISAEGSSWVPSFSSQAAVDSTNNRHLLLLVDSTMVTLDKLGPKRTTTESSAFCIESYKVVKTTFLLLSQFAY